MNIEKEIFNLLENSKFTHDISISKARIGSHNFKREEFLVCIDDFKFYSVKYINRDYTTPYTYKCNIKKHNLNNYDLYNLIKTKTIKYNRNKKIDKLTDL